MRKLFFNSKIYIEKDIFHEAILIEDNKIIKTGKSFDLLKESYDEKIDCQSNVILPAFNDSHCHILMSAAMNTMPNIMNAKSIDEVIGICIQFLKDNPDRKYLYAMGWHTSVFNKGEIRNLNKTDLDKISTEIPIVLARGCGHIVVLNSLAIELADITKTTKVDGGLVEIEDNQITGLLAENARFLGTNLIPELSDDDYVLATNSLYKKLLSYGITSVQTNDFGLSVDFKKADRIYKKIYKNSNPIRTYHQICYKDEESFKSLLEDSFYKNEYNSLGPIKLFKDGSLGGSSAMMKEEYLNEKGNFGVEVITDEEVSKYTEFAYRNNLQVITHSIGDKASCKMIDSYKEYIDKNNNKYRWGLVHFQISDKELVEKAIKNRMTIFAQPVFLRTDIEGVKGKISTEKQETSYAFKSLYKGTDLAISTDAPIESYNPFENIYCAVTRKNLEGKPENGFFVEEALSVDEAIDAYTYKAAFMQFKEKKLGRLKKDYLADFIIIDQDIFTIDKEKIKDLKVLLTVYDGNIVHKI